MSYRTNTFDVEIPSIESARNTLLRFIVTFLFLTFSIPLLSSNGQTSSGTDKQGNPKDFFSLAGPGWFCPPAWSKPFA